MKKFMALLSVIMLCASVSLTAFALPSPQGGRITAKDKHGNDLELSKKEESELNDSDECDHGEDCDGCIDIVTPITKKYKDKAKKFLDEDGIKNLIKGTKYEDKEWEYAFELEAIAKNCVDLPATLFWDMDDWAEGKPIAVYFDTETGTWKLLDLTEEDGKLALVITQKRTPIIFFLEKGSVADPESPKTGDPVSLGFALMGVGAAGLALVAKKKED